MQHILASHSICLPLHTIDDRNAAPWSQPDMLLHVHITVMRTRYGSLLHDAERNHDHDDSHRFPDFYKQARRPDAQSKRIPTVNDPRVNDPKFREKYMLN